MDFVLFVILSALFLILVVLVSNYPIIAEDYRKRKLEKQGIEQRAVHDSYSFRIYKQREDTKYYLNIDENWYSSTVGTAIRRFHSEEERDSYIKHHLNEFKERYGEDIQIERVSIYLGIGECKKLEE